ncbi:MAG: hypothetical protein WD768_07230 [Phycisphaeraceae bacterium]
MATQGNVTELARMIHRLQQERQQHVDAIAEIDGAFQSLGITPQTSRRGRKSKLLKQAAAAAPSAPPAGKTGGKKRRRRRGKFAQTGEQFIAGLLEGGKKLSTGDVNKQWISSGRKNRADITLGKMVKDGSLKRTKIKGERGSNYSL